MTGLYEKHNTNVGATQSGGMPEERNTPQAFSHFTFEASNQKLLICDIQGVDDIYTDPQIHSVLDEFGKGNLGATGMKAFLTRHQCNAICCFLKLPVRELKRNDRGTQPEEGFRELLAEAAASDASGSPSLARAAGSSSSLDEPAPSSTESAAPRTTTTLPLASRRFDANGEIDRFSPSPEPIDKRKLRVVSTSPGGPGEDSVDLDDLLNDLGSSDED